MQHEPNKSAGLWLTGETQAARCECTACQPAEGVPYAAAGRPTVADRFQQLVSGPKVLLSDVYICQDHLQHITSALVHPPPAQQQLVHLADGNHDLAAFCQQLYFTRWSKLLQVMLAKIPNIAKVIVRSGVDLEKILTFQCYKRSWRGELYSTAGAKVDSSLVW